MNSNFKEYDSHIQNLYYIENYKILQEIQYYLNKDVHSLYREYVKKESDLIKDISNLNNNLYEYFSIYYTLLYKGILSIPVSSNKLKYVFDTDSSEIVFDSGTSIVSGKGVCRNISSNFSNVLLELSPNTTNVCVGINGDDANVKLKRHLDIPINIEYKEDEQSIEDTVLNTPNHSVVLVHSDNFQLLDPARFIITNIYTDEKTNERKFCDMRYSLFECDRFPTIENRKELLKKVRNIMKKFEYAKWETLPKDDLIILRDYGYQLCKNNQNIIQNFLKETQPLKEEITEKKKEISYQLNKRFN